MRAAQVVCEISVLIASSKPVAVLILPNFGVSIFQGGLRWTKDNIYEFLTASRFF